MDTGKQLVPAAAAAVPIAVPLQAEAATARLRAALQGAGFDVERDFEHCRADVTTSGMGTVTLGRLSVTTAERLAEVLEALPRRAATDAPPVGDED